MDPHVNVDIIYIHVHVVAMYFTRKFGVEKFERLAPDLIVSPGVSQDCHFLKSISYPERGGRVTGILPRLSRKLIDFPLPTAWIFAIRPAQLTGCFVSLVSKTFYAENTIAALIYSDIAWIIRYSAGR